MSHNRKTAAAYRGRIRLLAILAAFGIVGVFILMGGTRQDGQPVLGTKTGGRLIAFEPFDKADGPMCQAVSASASQSLLAVLQQNEAAEAAQGSPERLPSDAQREAASKRPPVHIMRDPSATFSGVAIDLAHNEVVLTDENNFSIVTYSRLENTPPSAKMSEPKRMIAGLDATLEFNCSVYVDPANGDIYSVNNDTLDWLTVFNRDVKGNMPPTRKVRAPHTVFGIAVDEQKHEMLLADQDDQAVVVFDKYAKDEDSPIRVLQGSKTQLADPHGIALDPKEGVIFVSNWGSTNVRPELGSKEAGKPPSFGGVARTMWPVVREKSIPGSGMLLPPSITVYPKDASANTPPLRVIQGPRALLDWPTALAVDPEHRELYVANDTADSVTVYSEDAKGDAAPIRVIKGPKTLVKNPTGLAYDEKNEELWVANFGDHAATVFKRTASGDTAPIRVIRSAPIDAPSPMMSNPHTIAYDTKRDQILVSN